MNAAPFLTVCLLFFGVMASAGLSLGKWQKGDKADKVFLSFCVIMTAWAAGLLLHPNT